MSEPRLEVVDLGRLEAVAETCREPAPAAAARTNGNGANGRAQPRLLVDRWLGHYGVAFRFKERTRWGPGYVLKECPFDAGHGAPDSIIMQDADGKLRFRCLHNSCRERTWQDVKAKIGDPLPEHYDPPLRGEGRHRRTAPKPSGDQEEIGLALTCLADVRPEPVRWLVPGYLPLGKTVLIAGDGGHGKSTLTLDLAARLTTGRPCLGLQYDPPEPADVLLVSCEDDYADTVVPRLLAAGADLSRIHRVDGLEAKGPGEGVRPFTLADYRALGKELERRQRVRLVAIDPAGAYIGRAGVDDHKDSELRALLGPLAELAARRRVLVLLVKHLSKGATVKAVYRVGGSAGYVNSARASFLVAPDPEEDERKLLLPLKFNLGPKPQGLAYGFQALGPEERVRLLGRFAGHLGPGDQERLAGQLFRLEWLGAVDTDAEAALGDWSHRPGRADKDLQAAADWLGRHLEARPCRSEECVARGNEALRLGKPAKWWRDSILKARLDGKPRKTGYGPGQRWWFTLRQHPWPFPGLEEGEEGEESTADSQQPGVRLFGEELPP